MYGVPQFAQAAAKLTGRTGVSSARSSAPSSAWTCPAARTAVPDPAGRHLLVLARDPDGYRRLCWVISTAQLAGGEKGRPVYDLAAPRRSARRALGDPDRLPQGRRPARARRRRGRRQAAAARNSERWPRMFGRDNVVVELTSHDQPDDDERNDALYELAASHRTR